MIEAIDRDVALKGGTGFGNRFERDHKSLTPYPRSANNRKHAIIGAAVNKQVTRRKAAC